MSATLQAPPSATVRGSTPWVAAPWALVFGALAALALIGRIPHPWAPDEVAVLAGLSGPSGSWMLTVIALAVLVAVAVAATTRAARSARGAGWILVLAGIVVTVVVSDVRALSFLGYLPMTLLALVGIGPVAGHVDLDVLAGSAGALAHAVGGVAIVANGVQAIDRAAVLTARRRAGWGGWVRWGGPAVSVAVVAPLAYAVTRIAWALGISFGIRDQTLDELGSARYAGLGLALFAVVGAWLTTGLLARWGAVFWSWVPRVGGRAVPIALALVPGLVVAGAVTTAGLSFWRLVLTGELARVPVATSDWAAWGPELLWPVWGVALAVACLAYLGRRSGAAGSLRR